jgi:hypothetical protein
MEEVVRDTVCLRLLLGLGARIRELPEVDTPKVSIESFQMQQEGCLEAFGMIDMDSWSYLKIVESMKVLEVINGNSASPSWKLPYIYTSIV